MGDYLITGALGGMGQALCRALSGAKHRVWSLDRPSDRTPEGWTLLLIGSEELGLKGWFHTEELAFGAETEEVICSFPSFDHAPLEGTPFETEVCQQLHDDFFWGFEFWLIGKTPAGDWLMLIDERLVCTVSPELVGETRPILHWWEDWEMIGPWDDEGEE